MRFHKFSLIVILFVSILESTRASRLSVSGNKLMFNGKSVFLSGVNFAWNSYGFDFGNGQYTANSKTTFEQWLKEVTINGGNSVRKLLGISLSYFSNANFFYSILSLRIRFRCLAPCGRR